MLNERTFIFFSLLLFTITNIPFTPNAQTSTDPSSPSFVPIPYPKSEPEVIEDLYYAIKKFYLPHKNTKVAFLENTDMDTEILTNLLEDKPVHKIHKICKVKNLKSYNESGYDWIIFIVRADGTEAARVAIGDTGLWLGTHTFDPEEPRQKPIKEEVVLSNLSSTIQMALSKKEVKKIELISIPPFLGNCLSPSWEITLVNGEIYYYQMYQKKFFKIKKKLDWRKDNRGKRPYWNNLVPSGEIISFDEVNDKLVVYEEITR